MSDMRDEHYKLKNLLIQKIKEKLLTEKEKDIIKIALEFGYASAYCSRTCDMNESFYAAGNFDDAYKHILEMLK